jgi:hypothetical protein
MIMRVNEKSSLLWGEKGEPAWVSLQLLFDSCNLKYIQIYVQVYKVLRLEYYVQLYILLMIHFISIH